VHLQNDVAFCFEMPERRVKTVNVDVCKKAPKLIGYYSNVSSTTAKLFQFYNSHIYAYQCCKVVEVRPVLAEIFGVCLVFVIPIAHKLSTI